MMIGENKFRVASIGELLWDLLPGSPQLGGAPANFAACIAQLSHAQQAPPAGTIFLISRVGKDDFGREALVRMKALGVSADFISIDASRPTGTVAVSLDAMGGPTYRIREDVAWDCIPNSAKLAALAPTLDAICYGTLAQRSQESRAAIRRTISETRLDCLRVFDVNLRSPNWNAEAIAWGCAHATILKMNLEEMQHVAKAAGAATREPLRVAHFLLQQFPIKIVIMTRGGDGGILVTRDQAYDFPGITVQVRDAIGAGDCFTAAFTYYVLHGCSLPAAANAANHLGAWVATQQGGMPLLNQDVRRLVERAMKDTVAADISCKTREM